MSVLDQFVEYASTWTNWTGPNGLLVRTWAHLRVSVAAVAIGITLAIPPALALGHRRVGGFLAVAVVNLGRAIPSLAVLALALPLSIRYGFGLGFWPTLVALVVLAVPPLFANTYAGVVAVDPATVAAARGVGMTEAQVVRSVELPLALPLIITGVRIATVQVLATATLGALVAFGGLGSVITEGLAQFNRGKALTGALLIAILAVITEVSLATATRRARRGQAATR